MESLNFSKPSFAAVVWGAKSAPSSPSFFPPFGPSIALPHGEEEGAWKG